MQGAGAINNGWPWRGRPKCARWGVHQVWVRLDSFRWSTPVSRTGKAGHYEPGKIRRGRQGDIAKGSKLRKHWAAGAFVIRYNHSSIGPFRAPSIFFFGRWQYQRHQHHDPHGNLVTKTRLKNGRAIRGGWSYLTVFISAKASRPLLRCKRKMSVWNRKKKRGGKEKRIKWTLLSTTAQQFATGLTKEIRNNLRKYLLFGKFCERLAARVMIPKLMFMSYLSRRLPEEIYSRVFH